MPRKAKEKEDLKEEKTIKKSPVKKSSTKKVTNKKTSSVKKATTKKATEKKPAASKSATKKKVATKKVSEEKVVKSRKTTSKKDTETKVKTKTTTAKKSTKKKTTVANKTSKKSTVKKSVPKRAIANEYYDLPQGYNKTVVKLLAQTPKTLFIYWEISNDDILKFKKQFGENFFETTKPILIIHNDSLNYSFEVEINDFANSWYLHVDDSKSNYRIELGRRPINDNSHSVSNYVHIAESNGIESPNDHILFDPSQKMAYFRNVKTNVSFMKNIGNIYDIYDQYKDLYNNEDIFDILSNPSSHTSSQFK